MTKQQTELVFILDKSGSMMGLERDTIGGYNSMLQKQRKEEGEAFVTTVLFNHKSYTLHDAIPLQELQLLTEADYTVGGMTALLDAIGFSIQNVMERQKNHKVDRKVLFVITTDGMENSSKEFTAEKVKTLIADRKEQAQWEFIFLGANIDALLTAETFGIGKDYAVNYHADGAGTKVNYDAISEAAVSFRKGQAIEENWKESIETDYKKRK